MSLHNSDKTVTLNSTILIPKSPSTSTIPKVHTGHNHLNAAEQRRTQLHTFSSLLLLQLHVPSLSTSPMSTHIQIQIHTQIPNSIKTLIPKNLVY